ncbi:hypothetical protein V2G26_017314 [Clonostachys chloroleuca]
MATRIGCAGSLDKSQSQIKRAVNYNIDGAKYTDDLDFQILITKDGTDTKKTRDALKRKVDIVNIQYLHDCEKQRKLVEIENQHRVLVEGGRDTSGGTGTPKTAEEEAAAAKKAGEDVATAATSAKKAEELAAEAAATVEKVNEALTAAEWAAAATAKNTKDEAVIKKVKEKAAEVVAAREKAVKAKEEAAAAAAAATKAEGEATAAAAAAEKDAEDDAVVKKARNDMAAAAAAAKKAEELAAAAATTAKKAESEATAAAAAAKNIQQTTGDDEKKMTKKIEEAASTVSESAKSVEAAKMEAQRKAEGVKEAVAAMEAAKLSATSEPDQAAKQKFMEAATEAAQRAEIEAKEATEAANNGKAAFEKILEKIQELLLWAKKLEESEADDATKQAARAFISTANEAKIKARSALDDAEAAVAAATEAKMKAQVPEKRSIHEIHTTITPEELQNILQRLRTLENELSSAGISYGWVKSMIPWMNKPDEFDNLDNVKPMPPFKYEGCNVSIVAILRFRSYALCIENSDHLPESERPRFPRSWLVTGANMLGQVEKFMEPGSKGGCNGAYKLPSQKVSNIKSKKHNEFMVLTVATTEDGAYAMVVGKNSVDEKWRVYSKSTILSKFRSRGERLLDNIRDASGQPRLGDGGETAQADYEEFERALGSFVKTEEVDDQMMLS